MRDKMNSNFDIYTKFWPYNLNIPAEIVTHWTSPQLSNLILFNLAELMLTILSMPTILISTSWVSMDYRCIGSFLHSSFLHKWQPGSKHLSAWLTYVLLLILSLHLGSLCDSLSPSLSPSARSEKKKYIYIFNSQWYFSENLTKRCLSIPQKTRF